MANEKKKVGRPKWTDEQRKAAAEAQADRKKKADSMKPEFIIQYEGNEAKTADIEMAVIANFRQTKKRAPITDMKVYIKPEEHTAYYVINEKHTGSIPF